MANKGPPPPYCPRGPQYGIFGFAERELNAAGRMIDREIGAVASTVTTEEQVLNNFATNNVVQLISRTSGRTLQVVQSATGHPVVDGCGADAKAFNNVWTVINEGSNMVRLHNNNHYLAVVNGTTTVVFMQPGTPHGIETKLRLSAMGNFVLMESCKETGRHVGILENGNLKPALATGRETHSHFGVRLVSTPYPQTGVIRK